MSDGTAARCLVMMMGTFVMAVFTLALWLSLRTDFQITIDFNGVGEGWSELIGFTLATPVFLYVTAKYCLEYARGS